MSQARCHQCGCPTPEVVEIPGVPGQDFAALPPIAGSPEGSQIGNPGQTILNSTDDSFWYKKTGTGSTGWIELIGPIA